MVDPFQADPTLAQLFEACKSNMSACMPLADRLEEWNCSPAAEWARQEMPEQAIFSLLYACGAREDFWCSLFYHEPSKKKDSWIVKVFEVMEGRKPKSAYGGAIHRSIKEHIDHIQQLERTHE